MTERKIRKVTNVFPNEEKSVFELKNDDIGKIFCYRNEYGESKMCKLLSYDNFYQKAIVGKTVPTRYSRTFDIPLEKLPKITVRYSDLNYAIVT
ncbi:hypothetical protein GCM10023231_24680 [Olivibacter ginsenosidimutans]|uniref:Uncharacterized protein n=1 Tax=Olivibacter ginsenosidimutans TaxID=1176537 RepID=A0ABP9BGL2_9SPHI